MRAVATSLALAIVTATSNLSWPCLCEDFGVPETAMAPDQSCCPSAKAEVELAEASDVWAVWMEGVCSPGCCDAPATITSRAAERAFTWEAAAQPQIEAALQVYTQAQAPSGSVIDRARPPRGPPEPLVTRLALLQTWHC